MRVFTVAMAVVNVYDSPIRSEERLENGPFCFPLSVLSTHFVITLLFTCYGISGLKTVH